VSRSENRFVWMRKLSAFLTAVNWLFSDVYLSDVFCDVVLETCEWTKARQKLCTVLFSTKHAEKMKSAMHCGTEGVFVGVLLYREGGQ